MAAHHADAPAESRIVLRDGRALAFRAAGPADGFPVVWLHGAIGSPGWRTPQLDALIALAGIRYVVVSRPGYGSSDPRLPALARAPRAGALAGGAALRALGAGGAATHAAMVEDYGVCRRPWGFDVARVAAPVALWHGAADRLVPAAHAVRLGRAMPRCTVSLERGAGHFFFRHRLAEIVGPVVPQP